VHWSLSNTKKLTEVRQFQMVSDSQEEIAISDRKRTQFDINLEEEQELTKEAIIPMSKIPEYKARKIRMNSYFSIFRFLK